MVKEKTTHVCNFCSEPVHGSVHITLTVPGNTSPPHFEHYHCRFPGDCWHQQQEKDKQKPSDLIAAA